MLLQQITVHRQLDRQLGLCVIGGPGSMCERTLFIFSLSVLVISRGIEDQFAIESRQLFTYKQVWRGQWTISSTS